jgi:hypothetical protein
MSIKPMKMLTCSHHAEAAMFVNSGRIQAGGTLAVTGSCSWLLSSPIRVSLMMDARRFSETLDLPRGTRRNIPEDGVLHIKNV